VIKPAESTCKVASLVWADRCKVVNWMIIVELGWKETTELRLKLSLKYPDLEKSTSLDMLFKAGSNCKNTSTSICMLKAHCQNISYFVRIDEHFLKP